MSANLPMRHLALSLFMLLAISLGAQERITHGDLIIVASIGGSYAGPAPYYAFFDVRHPSGAQKTFVGRDDFAGFSILPAADMFYVGDFSRVHAFSPFCSGPRPSSPAIATSWI